MVLQTFHSSIFHFLITWLSYLLILSYLVTVTCHTDLQTYHMIHHLIKSHNQSHMWPHLMQTVPLQVTITHFYYICFWITLAHALYPMLLFANSIIKRDIHLLNLFWLSYSHMLTLLSHSLFSALVLDRLLPSSHCYIRRFDSQWF
jgi:hypothetical protein